MGFKVNNEKKGTNCGPDKTLEISEHFAIFHNRLNYNDIN